MLSADLATLSLLDPDQGVCPNGHRCRLDQIVSRRRCEAGEYVGMALICWGITGDEIDLARQKGADDDVVDWAYSSIANRD